MLTNDYLLSKIRTYSERLEWARQARNEFYILGNTEEVDFWNGVITDLGMELKRLTVELDS